LLSIQKITPTNIEAFKMTRLSALQDTPLAFGSTYEREAAFSADDWRVRVQRWNGATGIGFLAIDKDLPCGIAGALLDRTNPKQADLVSMWTAPTHRRRGAGKLLVEHVIAWAQSRGAERLRLLVTNTNDTAIRFYQRLGFALTGRTEPYPNDPALQELEMHLSIVGLTRPAS